MHLVRTLAQRILPTTIAALIGLLALSCGGGTTAPPTPAPVATVQLTPSTNTLIVGQTVQLTSSIKDANGNVLTGRTVQWSSSAASIATVSSSGLVTAVSPGPATIYATSEGKTGSATITVGAIPVNALVLTPPTSSLIVGATVQLSAVTTDSAGRTLTGRVVAWASLTPAVATVSNSGLVTAVAIGTTSITATSEGKSDSTLITVQACSATLQLAVGEIHTLTTAERSSLCLSAGTSASEYALVPFDNSTVASSTIPVTFVATNTSAVLQPLSSRQPPSLGALGMPTVAITSRSLEGEFRTRERAELTPLLARASRAGAFSGAGIVHPFLTGISATPTVGSFVQLNASLSGGLCSAKQLHAAKVVTVLPHTIVLIDSLSPSGGYTDAQMIAFGQSFDTLGFALDTLNFGAPTDIDGNGRIAIFFTPGVNAIPGPPGGYVGGLQTTRDLIPVASCPGSNEGEMFYMPVPDPNGTINANYTSASALSNTVLSVLVHEFQHLINAGRRIFVNNSSSLEEVWLNEGLSHISEELLYYKVSGNAPMSNIGLPLVTSTQAQLDAANTYQLQNLSRLKSYMLAPEINSPYSQVDGLEMRGAIWELLRYSQDRKGGSERATWYPLVNTTLTGQANFNAVFGSITTLAHDWSIAQLTDDAALGVVANYTNPSWNFRSLLPPLNGGAFPLLTRALLSSPLTITLNGGGTSYVRFRVAANATGTVAATSSGSALPASVDLTLVRTQ